MIASSVRAATPDDAQAIAEAHVASWRAAYASIVPARVLDGLSVDRRAEFWRGVAADPGETRVWVAEAGRRVVGFASTGPARDTDLPAGAAELQAIYLEPGSWGTGLGRALLQRAVGDLVERRFRPLVLWVLAGNERGRHFYERAGWEWDGTRRDLDFDGESVEELRFRAANA